MGKAVGVDVRLVVMIDVIVNVPRYLRTYIYTHTYIYIYGKKCYPYSPGTSRLSDLWIECKQGSSVKSASAVRPEYHVGAEDRKVTIRLKAPYSPTHLYVVGWR